MSEALKELFNAYKHLPIGVMFFKDKHLFFVNDHLRSILLLQNLGSDEVIQIIGDMVGIENTSHESLCDFFSFSELFLYHDRLLQIDRQHFDNIDIFVIVRISDESVKMVDETRSLRQMRQSAPLSASNLQQDEHVLLAKALGDWEKVNLPSVVLYKGIPIKADCIIVHAFEGEIAIKVEKKQLSAAHIGAQWLIGNRRDKMVSGEIAKYDLSQSVVWLYNLQIVNSGFYLRQVIRYGASSEDQMIISISGKKYVSPLHDISEKGSSIQTDNGALLIALSSVKGKTLDAELVLSGTKISIRVVWLYTIALESGIQMKAAFSIGYDLHNGSLLREWLNEKQLQLIKEVRSFVQMIPTPNTEPAVEWTI
jgi:hypothetical protein